MSTTTLTAPIPADTAGVHTRPGLGRLVAVELRKMVDTRAGFWLQVATVVLTVVVVVASVRRSATRRTTPSPPSSTTGCSRRPSCCRSPASCSSPRSGPSAPG